MSFFKVLLNVFALIGAFALGYVITMWIFG